MGPSSSSVLVLFLIGPAWLLAEPPRCRQVPASWKTDTPAKSVVAENLIAAVVTA